MGSPSPAKRIRKPSWAPEEVRILLQELQLHGKYLVGANTASNTAKVKAKAMLTQLLTKSCYEEMIRAVMVEKSTLFRGISGMYSLIHITQYRSLCACLLQQR